MVNVMKKRESGDGAAITYVMIWFTLMVAFIIIVFVQFNSNIYIAKSEMETGLHIVEGSVMVRSQKFYTGSVYADEFERDLQRAHIITSDIKTSKVSDGKRTESFSGNTDYLDQCEKIGNAITQGLKDQFFLDEHSVPQAGAIALLSFQRKSGTKMFIHQDVIIYEPTYDYVVKKTATGDSSKPWAFVESGTVTGWKQYALHFDENNNYTGVTVKNLTTTPKLKNGDLCEGATIEMTIKIDFYGINKIFADAASSTGNAHTVYVTQSTDIVLVNLDSRTAN